jgi:uncharacterized protein DUF6046
MKIKPMIGGYEIPKIQRIGTIEDRRLVEVSVPGLRGSYHQDVGSGPVSIRIEGTLASDDQREQFLTEVRGKFTAGEPVEFVADITTATEIQNVLISDLSVREVAGSPDTFRYAMTLTQHVEPPSTAPGAALGFANLAALNASLDLEAAGLFDVLQIPDLLGSIPNFGDPTPPLKTALSGVAAATAGLGETLQPLRNIFGDAG